MTPNLPQPQTDSMAEILLILRFLLAGILYAFLGLTFYILWRGLQRDGNVSPETELLPAKIVSRNSTETPVDLSLHLVTAIGRAEDNTLILDDPYTSAHHALILWREGRWWLEDLDSHNGTFLNDEPVTRPVLLSPGDTVLIGKTELIFETEGNPT